MSLHWTDFRISLLKLHFLNLPWNKKNKPLKGRQRYQTLDKLRHILALETEHRTTEYSVLCLLDTEIKQNFLLTGLKRELIGWLLVLFPFTAENCQHLQQDRRAVLFIGLQRELLGTKQRPTSTNKLDPDMKDLFKGKHSSLRYFTLL